VVDLLIRHGTVVTLDSTKRIIQDGAVSVEDGEIIDVGKSVELSRKSPADTRIDASGMLVLPGFIDGHHHSTQYLSKGIGDDVQILDWLYKRVYPYEVHLTPSDAYVGALGDFVEMVKSGTTCFADPGGYHMDRVVEAMDEVGVRGVISRSTRDLSGKSTPVPSELMESTEDAVRYGEELVKKYNKKSRSERVRACFSLRYVYNVSDELASRIKELADKYGVAIHAHLAAVKGENEEVQRMWGVRSLGRYQRLGLLAPNLYLVHMGWVNDQEIELLKKHDVKVCHCPSASMHGAYGNISTLAFPKMVAKGITVSLGSDSATAGRFLDMVRVMYLAACSHKDAYADPQVMDAYKALEMATREGARALLWDDQIGSIEVGKRADVILVDMKGQEWWPMRDPITNLVYSADGSSVRTVIIDGKLVMFDRKMVSVAEEKVREAVIKSSDELMDRAGIEVHSRWPVE